MNESDVTALVVFVIPGILVAAVFASGYWCIPGF